MKWPSNHPRCCVLVSGLSCNYELPNCKWCRAPVIVSPSPTGPRAYGRSPVSTAHLFGCTNVAFMTELPTEAAVALRYAHQSAPLRRRSPVVRALLVIQVPNARNERRMAFALGPINRLPQRLECAECTAGMIFDDEIRSWGPFPVALRTRLHVNVRHIHSPASCRRHG